MFKVSEWKAQQGLSLNWAKFMEKRKPVIERQVLSPKCHQINTTNDKFLNGLVDSVSVSQVTTITINLPCGKLAFKAHPSPEQHH